jgi:hypothetical protein
MPSVQSYVLALPWPLLVSLDTYHQLGRVREHVTFVHGDDFQGRLILATTDGLAQAWAEIVDPPPGPIEGDDEPEKVRSQFEGSAKGLVAVTGDPSADMILNLEQDMEFYLRTLADVMLMAAPHLEKQWVDSRRRWGNVRDQPDAPAAAVPLPPAGDVDGFIPVRITLRANTEAELRAKFVAEAFETMSPWSHYAGV